MPTYLMNTYKRQNITFTKGKGIWLWDKNGNKYLDAVCGYGVCGLGHAHSEITKTICQQAETLLHTSNLYNIDTQEELAAMLTHQAKLDKAFFCNSGTEANEAAIKLARLHGHQQQFKNPLIIVTEGAFHGRTMGSLSATDGNKIKEGFGSLVPGFIRVSFNNINAIHELIAQHKEISAIMLEPIQGVGGIKVANYAYLCELRKLCNEHNILLIMDEVQTGIGRTGNLFAYQNYNIIPDIVSAAKCLGNGIPIGVCLANDSVATLFKQESHGTTFGGNPFACSVALTVLKTIEKLQLLNHVKNMSKFIFHRLYLMLKNDTRVVDIRGMGLMIGIELNIPCGHLVEIAINKGLLVSVVSQSVIRLLPPLIINQAEAETMLSILKESIQSI